ncbi:hypothetical protein DL96DRAFT_1610219 [Flagelloscypha sp. PMI_526]|nr:hypothetical protein DL96DRAFT_1610219 [Flagelloscypha sp. PMI_526]
MSAMAASAPKLESATPRLAYNPASQTYTVRRVELSSPEHVYPAQTELESRKKYKCTVCDRSFTTSGHLTRHGHIHTGEKKYACPFPDCKTRCSRQDNLQQHYRTHLSATSRQNMSKARQATRVVAPAPPLTMASPDNASPPRSDAGRSASPPTIHEASPDANYSHPHFSRPSSPGRFAAERLPPLNTHFASRASSPASDVPSSSTSASAQHPQLPPIHVPPSPIDAANPILPHTARRRPVCANCGTTETPLWRRGVTEEDKDKLFCNACGLYEKTHKRKRPQVMALQHQHQQAQSHEHLHGSSNFSFSPENTPSEVPVEDIQRCANCRTNSTPIWRKDDQGRGVCNACGLYTKLHGASRPVSLRSDSFLHRRSRTDGTSNGDASDADSLPSPSVSPPLHIRGPPVPPLTRTTLYADSPSPELKRAQKRTRLDSSGSAAPPVVDGVAASR